jgi:hypothetical protein
LTSSTKTEIKNPFFFYSICSKFINGQYREGKLEPKVYEWAWAMSRQLQLLHPSPGRAFRGVDVSDFSDDQIAKRFLSGEYCDEAFTSASLSYDVAIWFASVEGSTKRIIFTIDHHSGRCIEDKVADEYKWEKELLFQPKTRFKLLNWKKVSPSQVEVYLQEM